MLENDVRKLRHDLSIYHTHLLKTEVWCDNIGKWSTRVSSARFVSPNDPFLTENNANTANNNSNENLVLFEIYVEMKNDINNLEGEEIFDYSLNSENQFKDGWVIYRSLKQFENLHEKLFEIIPADIKNQFRKIPNLKRNLLSKNFNDEKIKQATLILNDYLKVILNEIFLF